MNRRKRTEVVREITELARDVLRIPMRRFEEAQASQPLLMARNMLKQVIQEASDDKQGS